MNWFISTSGVCKCGEPAVFSTVFDRFCKECAIKFLRREADESHKTSGEHERFSQRCLGWLAEIEKM